MEGTWTWQQTPEIPAPQRLMGSKTKLPWTPQEDQKGGGGEKEGSGEEENK